MDATVESLTSDIAKLTGNLETAKTAADNATKTFVKRQKDASVEELLGLADGVKSAQGAVTKAQNAINSKQRQLDVLQWEAKSKPLQDARERIRTANDNAIKAEREVLTSFGVEKVATGSTINADGVTTTVNVSGEGVPKAPSRISSGNGRGGPRGKITYQTPDGEMGSAQLMEAYGLEVLGQERFEKVQADPHGQGLSHIAKRIAKSKGFDFVTSEPGS